MERSSSSYTSEPRSRVMCLCNLETSLVTGRKGCNYFEWHDPVANSHQKRIIVALMRKVDELNFRENDLQTRIDDKKMKGNFLGIGLIFQTPPGPHTLLPHQSQKNLQPIAKYQSHN
ncbi:hypothetical protein GmHk_01G001334 [Glycine max]|nr:hypothetical protein GmHk_01G001334 [Glycine max]